MSNQQQVVLVNGMGGIGKTALAQTYATFNRENYAHIAWVQQTSDDFRQDLISAEGLLDSLNLSTTSTVEELFPKVINKLRSLENQPNLLVIDNAFASLTKIKDQLPKQPHWHILITSREEIAGFELKELGFLSKAAAIDLFKRHYSLTKLQDAEIATIVKTIDYHTLTIELLAKVAQRKRTILDELLVAIKDDITANVCTNHSQGGNKIERIRSYLCSIFKADRLSKREIYLLKQLTCLPTEFHSYEILEDLLNVKEAFDFTLSEILESLKESGWLIADRKNDSYKIHQIIQLALFTQLNVQLNDVDLLVENIKNKLSLDQFKDNPINKSSWIPFGQCIDSLFSHLTDAQIGSLQNNLALRYRDFGNYQNAKILLEKSIKSSEQILGEDAPETATCYLNLGVVLKYLGKYQDSKNLLSKALLLGIKNFGDEHEFTSTCYSNLGLTHYILGELRDAEILLKKAIAYDEIKFGKDHPSTAVSYTNLGGILMELNDLKTAKRLFETALRSNQMNLDAKHPDMATSYSNLGLALHSLGDFQQAKELLNTALNLDLENFGIMHPVIAKRYSHLGGLLADLKNYSCARKLLKKALILNIKNFGETHPSVGASYYDLSTVLYEVGDYKKAFYSITQALNIFQHTYSHNHPLLREVYSCYESIQRKLDSN